MRTRTKVTTIIRDVEQNAAEYTITKGGVPVAVVVPYEKLHVLRDELAGSYQGGKGKPADV